MPKIENQNSFTGFIYLSAWTVCFLVLTSAVASAQNSSPPVFFTSFEPKDTPLTWVDTPDSGTCGRKATQHADVMLATHISSGPPSYMTFTAKPGVGFSGLYSLAYAGTQKSSGEGVACNQIFNVSIPVKPDMELSYVILPEYTDEDWRYPSAHVAIDLVFTDGSYLSSLDVRDQHGIPLRAADQARVLYVNQWNYVSAEIGTVAAGKTIERILLSYDNSNGATQFAGFVDDLRIAPRKQEEPRTHASDYVNTLRGTNSNGKFSRGNTFPAVAVPHGFNFWTPATSVGSDWIYQYSENNGPDNLPRMEAFELSHEPSPWMGDRQTFYVMPSAQAPTEDRSVRALAFRHSNETAHPHYYKVQFENGIITEITPTDHCAVFRFRFPGKDAYLTFDQISKQMAISLDQSTHSLSGYSDVGSWLSTGATRLFFYATFDRPTVGNGNLDGHGSKTSWLSFDIHDTPQQVVTMRIATSLISLAQARRNLSQEIAPDDTFESVEARAQSLWDKKLGIIQVQGATHDQLVTLYSNLYRLFLYPNSAYENTGTPEHPEYKYASPFSPPAKENTATETGARIVPGRVFVNNGFWDTYRTAWPAFVLLTPTEAGEMIDGFVQQYRDGGWIARWSSPGYADLMTGTSADIAFADAWLKGVRNFDVRSFYQSALKDATVVSPLPGTGRKGLNRSIFSGYVDTKVHEGLSWALDGYINDFGIANLASALAAENDTSDLYHSHYGEDARYFRNRAQEYVTLFNHDLGFFVGRNPDGSWDATVQSFDPISWGGDYTETDAWNMAFHAPHDGQGLTNLYGGRAALAAKLDKFFATPGEFHTGAYGGVIHEMLEAQAVRMGQYGHSNQPSHHIIYMYDYVQQPWKVQDKVRDVLSRLYMGSEIGQGYPGDEDNGEMSAWWLFSAAGFYPLQMGRPEYAIGAPFFEHMTIQLENGKQITINAPGVSDRNRYVQSLKVNGREYGKSTIPHQLLTQGATLDFTMGPALSKWASSEEDVPSSLTSGDQIPSPLRDLTGPGQGEASASAGVENVDRLFDNTCDTDSRFMAKPIWVEYHFRSAQKVEMYTLTSGAEGGDPKDWKLEGSADGNTWTSLDERTNETFSWRRQTRAFTVSHPGEYLFYRLTMQISTNPTYSALSEIELLGHP